MDIVADAHRQRRKNGKIDSRENCIRKKITSGQEEKEESHLCNTSEGEGKQCFLDKKIRKMFARAEKEGDVGELSLRRPWSTEKVGLNKVKLTKNRPSRKGGVGVNIRGTSRLQIIV